MAQPTSKLAYLPIKSDWTTLAQNKQAAHIYIYINFSWAKDSLGEKENCTPLWMKQYFYIIDAGFRFRVQGSTLVWTKDLQRQKKGKRWKNNSILWDNILLSKTIKIMGSSPGDPSIKSLQTNNTNDSIDESHFPKKIGRAVATETIHDLSCKPFHSLASLTYIILNQLCDSYIIFTQCRRHQWCCIMAKVIKPCLSLWLHSCHNVFLMWHNTIIAAVWTYRASYTEYSHKHTWQTCT